MPGGCELSHSSAWLRGRHSLTTQSRMPPGRPWALPNLSGTQSEDLPRLRRGGNLPAELVAGIDDLFYQLSVARREAIGRDAQVVFQAGAHVPAGFHAPLVYFPLVAADARSHPGGARQDLLDLAPQEIEDRAPRGHGVRDAHHELHVRRVLE